MYKYLLTFIAGAAVGAASMFAYHKIKSKQIIEKCDQDMQRVVERAKAKYETKDDIITEEESPEVDAVEEAFANKYGPTNVEESYAKAEKAQERYSGKAAKSDQIQLTSLKECEESGISDDYDILEWTLWKDGVITDNDLNGKVVRDAISHIGMTATSCIGAFGDENMIVVANHLEEKIYQITAVKESYRGD